MIKYYNSLREHNLAYYCNCFSKLKVYKSQKKGDALNKPVLILSVIELISKEFIKNNQISISDDLIETFKTYWELTTNNSFKGSDFALPFFHLKNEKCKFWHLQYSSEYDGGRPQTIPKLREDVNYAYLDDELFILIQDDLYRRELIDAIVSSWFSDEENILEYIININEKFQNENFKYETVSKDFLNSESHPKRSLRSTLIRNAFFRKSIVHIYDYKCAFCGLRVTKAANQNIVDGAHIKPFAQFYDSRIHNGIALCKNHHWAFDRGWFTADEQYKIVVSKELKEISPHAKPMKVFHGESLLLPAKEQYFPELEALQWHRQNIFQG
ncbi:HNH endonuclease [Anabaena sp. 4-3]|uniref:HNH endonuclease n=1 Tax=Anabaena sp. 4-3 TaxID=1811979 RepID=UPI000831E466|nr:HNH endonuclease [Anabaena sp. 4-3]